MSTETVAQTAAEQKAAELLQTFEETGALRVGADDTTSATAGMVAPQPLSQTSVPVPAVADEDPLLKPQPDTLSPLLAREGYLAETVELTDAIKSAFVDAIITNTRFVQPFKLYGGRITGKFRGRTTLEHDAIVSQLQRLHTSKAFTTASVYYRHLRALALTMHVAELNGTVFPEPQEPLQPIQNADGSVIEPGWLAQYEYWLKLDGMQPGLTSPLFIQLQKFDRLYWALVDASTQENF